MNIVVVNTCESWCAFTTFTFLDLNAPVQDQEGEGGAERGWEVSNYKYIVYLKLYIIYYYKLYPREEIKPISLLSSYFLHFVLHSHYFDVKKCHCNQCLHSHLHHMASKAVGIRFGCLDFKGSRFTFV